MARKGENIRKRADGRWEARYIKGHTPEGKAQLGYVYAYSYTEAKEKRQKILNEQIQMTNGKKFNDLIEAFLIQKEYTVKYSTYVHYKDIIDVHIAPYFGNFQLGRLTAMHIEEFSSEKLKNGKANGKGGLSPKSVKDILSIMKSMLKYGVEKNLVKEEVLSFEAPRVTVKPVETFTKEEITKIENYCIRSNEPYTTGILLCLYTGIRIGEICALRYDDIDLLNSYFTVSKTMMRVKETADSKKTVIRIDEPKTKTSIREIPLPEILRKKLLEQKLQTVCENAYVLTGNDNFLEPRTYYEKYQKFLKECGISPHSFHCLRHTFATVCIEKGFDPKTLSEILGHSDVKVTLGRYVHPSIQRKRDCMDLLDEEKKNN